jgi:hypothetical protein
MYFYVAAQFLVCSELSDSIICYCVPTLPPIQWVLGALSLWVKQPGHEADHPPPSSAKVKIALIYTSTPPVCFHVVLLS